MYSLKGINRIEHYFFKYLLDLNRSWKEVAKEIMKDYVERTDGSFLEENESSICWNFRITDQDFGKMQAKELAAQLLLILEFFLVEVVLETHYVQVKPKNISKGDFIEKIIEEIEKRRGPLDFILSIGDDSSDESVFKFLNKKYSYQFQSPIKKVIFY